MLHEAQPAAPNPLLPLLKVHMVQYASFLLPAQPAHYSQANCAPPLGSRRRISIKSPESLAAEPAGNSNWSEHGNQENRCGQHNRYCLGGNPGSRHDCLRTHRYICISLVRVWQKGGLGKRTRREEQISSYIQERTRELLSQEKQLFHQPKN